jgi:hypothetical protein
MIFLEMMQVGQRSAVVRPLLQASRLTSAVSLRPVPTALQWGAAKLRAPERHSAGFWFDGLSYAAIATTSQAPSESHLDSVLSGHGTGSSSDCERPLQPPTDLPSRACRPPPQDDFPQASGSATTAGNREADQDALSRSAIAKGSSVTGAGIREGGGPSATTTILRPAGGYTCRGSATSTDSAETAGASRQTKTPALAERGYSARP